MVAAQGNDRRCARSRHTRNTAYRVQRASGERASLIVDGVSRSRQADHRRDDSTGLEPRIDRQKAAEAGQQESRANEEHERKRHLRKDESAPHRASCASARAGSALLVQSGAEIQFEHMRDRHESDQRANGDRHRKREGDDGAVHVNFVDAREAVQSNGPKRAERH